MVLLYLLVAFLSFLFMKSQDQSGSGGFSPESTMRKAGAAVVCFASLVAAVVYFVLWIRG